MIALPRPSDPASASTVASETATSPTFAACATTAARQRWHRTRAGLLAALATLALAACGGGGGGGGGGGDAPPPPGGGTTPPTFTATQLLPLAPGHRWVYQLQDGAGRPVDTLIATVVGQETVAGQPAWRLTTRSMADPAGDESEFYRVDADGIRSVPGPGADPFETQLGPALVLRSGFSPGDTWVALDRDLGTTVDVDGDGRLDGVRARAVVTVQPVTTLTTAAGALSGVAHLRTVTTLTVTPGAGGGAVTVRITSDDWYAPGIGPVRNTLRAEDPDFGVDLNIAVLAWSVGAQRSDTQPPALSSADPADGSAVLFAALRYSFSEAMDRRTLSDGGFALLNAAGQPVPGDLAWNVAGTAFDFIPSFALPEGDYSARFGVSATDLAGNALPAATVTFRVDRSGPVVVSSTPLPGSGGAAADAVIELQFDEPLGNINPLFTLIQAENGAELNLSVEVQGARVLLRPSTPLVPGATYRVRSVVDLIDTNFNVGPAVDFSFRVAAGRFGLGQTLPGALQLATVQATDINGDGRADLLAIGRRSDLTGPGTQLLLWRQQAVGGLVAVQTLPVPAGCEPRAMDAGDVDADGRVDVVFSAFAISGATCGIGWLKQAADGSFAFGGWAQQPQSHPVLRLLAVPGAQRPALVVGDTNVLALIEPEGASGFAPARELARAVSDIQDALVGDLDADGRSDLLLLGRSPSGIGWAALRQGADGSFAPLGEGQTLDCRLFSECALALGPANLAGLPELFAGFPRVNELTDLSFAAQRLAPAGPGTWTLADTLPVALSPHALALADVDGDGRLDLVTAHGPQGAVGVTLRRADGQWDVQALFAAPLTGGEPRSLAVADFNGDGRPDIVLGASLLLQSAPLGTGTASPAAQRRPGVAAMAAQALRATAPQGAGRR